MEMGERRRGVAGPQGSKKVDFFFFFLRKCWRRQFQKSGEEGKL